MKSKNCVQLLLFFLIFFFGCAAHSTYFHKKPEGEKKDYQYVQIPDFKKTDSEWVPPDSTTLIPDMLYEKILRSRKYKLVERSSQRFDHGEDNVLMIKGVVTGYDKGCKYCEMIFMGINDKGKGSTSIWVQLVDKNSGKTIADFGVHGRAKDPGHGRSKYERVVDEIVKIVKTIDTN